MFFDTQLSRRKKNMQWHKIHTKLIELCRRQNPSFSSCIKQQIKNMFGNAVQTMFSKNLNLNFFVKI